MSFRDAFISVAVAVAAGILIGAERQQAQTRGQSDDTAHDTTDASTDAAARPPKSIARAEFGGIRTFPLIALLGALGALARPAVGLWLLGGLLLGVVAFITVSHVRASSRDEIGVSTEVAALITFALGALAALPELLPDAQRYLLVASCAAVTLALLALKQPMHRFVGSVSADDVYATTKFVVLALIVLPVLPDQAYGPLAVLNPHKIGFMIVLVAGISFTGYLAARLVGSHRGLLLTGLLGGLVSSTAVTLTYAGRSRTEPRVAAVAAVAVIAACSTMFARIVAVVAVVDRPLLSALAPALGAMALVGFGAAALLWRRSTRRAPEADKDAAGAAPDASGPSGEIRLRNPFELRQAVSFGLLYGAVLFVAKAAQTFLGTGGLYASSVLAGLTDVDAITLSVTELHRGGLAAPAAATAISLAAVTNTIVKSGIAISIGARALGRQVAFALGLALAAGGAVLVVLRLLA